MREVPQNQGYVDKHEAKLEAITKMKQETISEDRTSRNDSRFYNENGTRDYENFQGKW